MSFLAPSVLWGLFAASVPLIIHLISIRKTQKIDFSTLRFIKSLEHETIRNLKLRQWLLLFLRTLAVILLVLVFARPVRVGYFPPWAAADQSTRMAFLVDNSASMSAHSDGKSLLERSKLTVLRLLKELEGKPLIDIYQTTPFEKLYSEDFVSLSNLQDVLSGIKETAAKDDIWTCVSRIVNESRLETGTSGAVANRELYILSDFPRTAPAEWTVSSSSSDEKGANWRFYLFLQPEVKNNLSVVSAEILSHLLMPNHLIAVGGNVRNSADEAQKDVPVQLYLEDRRVGQVVSDFAPSAVKNFVFRAFSAHSGTVQGEIEVPADDYEWDNRRFFQFHIPDRIRCKIVATSGESISLLRLALSAINRDTLFVVVDELLSSSPGPLSLDNSDVLILVNPGELGTPATREIEQFSQRGGGIIAFLGDRYVRSNGQGLPRSLSFPPALELVTLQGNAFHAVNYVNEDHPLFSDFPVVNLAQEMPEVFSHVRSRPGEESDTILSLSDSDPLLVELKRDGTKILVLTTLPDLRWTDLPARGMFVPLLHRMLVYLTGHVGNENSVEVGAKVEIPLAGETISGELELVKPSGRTTLLVPDYRRELVAIQETDETGTYHLLADEEEIASFVVNVSYSEDPALRLSEEALLQLFPEKRSRLVRPGQDALAAVHEARRGTELWRPFLIAALAVLALETWIGRVRKEPFSHD